MKKKSLLLAIASMSVAAIGVGTVGTFAWYASTTAATTSAVAGDAYKLSSVASTVAAANYDITVTPSVSYGTGVSGLQLTNAVAVTAETTTYKLQYGAVAGGKAVVKDCEGASGFVGTISFTATWRDTVSAEDKPVLKGKTLTGGIFTTENYAKLINANAVSGLTAGSQDSGTYEIDIADDDALTLTVRVTANGYVRIQASSTQENGAAATAEAAHGENDKVKVTAGALAFSA